MTIADALVFPLSPVRNARIQRRRQSGERAGVRGSAESLFPYEFDIRISFHTNQRPLRWCSVTRRREPTNQRESADIRPPPPALPPERGEGVNNPQLSDGKLEPMTSPMQSTPSSASPAHWSRWWERRHTVIAAIALLGICAYLVLHYGLAVPEPTVRSILWFVLAVGGGPLVIELAVKLLRRQFGSDLLAGLSIVTAVLLGEYLAGTLVVLMLSGGEALESFAVRRASSVLDALARRMPSVAHRKSATGLADIPLTDIAVGDVLVVLPHEVCPVDGVVAEGHGNMDEAYLTGEPYRVSKSVGSEVLSGAINGESALNIEATRLPVDSRYARIMQVMQHSQQQRPQLRRLGDQLGAFYTPLAVAIALAAWFASGEPLRFLAVLVIATPCPLLIAIPVAIIGSISLAARRSIIIRDPAVLERIGGCRTMIFDKTGTLTYGEPQLTEQHVAPGFEEANVLQFAASIEQYSKHPLATPVVNAVRAARLALLPVAAGSGTPRRRPGCDDRGPHVAGDERQAVAERAARCACRTARGYRRTGMRDHDRRPVRRDVPLSRRAAGGGPAVHRASGSAARLPQDHARLRRPPVRSRIPGAAGRHHRSVCRQESGRETGDRSHRKPPTTTRSTSATASMTRRPWSPRPWDWRWGSEAK